jgi:hypothetical protein
MDAKVLLACSYMLSPPPTIPATWKFPLLCTLMLDQVCGGGGETPEGLKV